MRHYKFKHQISVISALWIALSTLSAPALAQTQTEIQRLTNFHKNSYIAKIADNRCAFLGGASRAFMDARLKEISAVLGKLDGGYKHMITTENALNTQVATLSCEQLGKDQAVVNIKVEADFYAAISLITWEQIESCTQYLDRDDIQTILAAYSKIISEAKARVEYKQMRASITQSRQMLRQQCATVEFSHHLPPSPIKDVMEQAIQIGHDAVLGPDAARLKIGRAAEVVAFRNTMPREDNGISIPWAVYREASEDRIEGVSGLMTTSHVHYGFLTDKRFVVHINTAWAANFKMDVYKRIDIKTLKDGKSYTLTKQTSEFITAPPHKDSITDNGQFVLSAQASAQIYAALKDGSDIQISTVRIVKGSPLTFNVETIKDEKFAQGIAYAFASKTFP